MWLHAAPCISRLNLKGLHTAPIVFEVYTVAPCGFLRPLAASCGPLRFHAAPVVFAGTLDCSVHALSGM